MSASSAHGVTVLHVDGVDVHLEGPADAPVVLMVHGWPDTHRLWDGTVAALHTDHRCARFTLPGYTPGESPVSVDAMMAVWLRVADAVSPGRPLTLLVHDWGCIFGYEFAARHPDRVARIVGVDVGDHNSRAFLGGLSGRERAILVGYQLWLALAWKLSALSRRLGDRMTRWMAQVLRAPAPAAAQHAGMNYPYAMRWFGSVGGFGRLARVDFAVPMFFVYGTRKYFMLHSRGWAEALAQRPHCRVQAFRTGHWIMLNDPAGFHAAVRAWLEETARA